MINHSIFNDVLGPIMSGPSSSHSAGCARIGRMTRLLLGKEIQKADIVFDENGSYPETYIGQGSNFGFTGGLLGYHTDDVRLKDAVEIAKQEGRDIRFSKSTLSGKHPNEARIDIWGEDGKVELSVLTFSTGGGMFEIVEMNGFPVFIDGSEKQLYLCCEENKTQEIQNKFEHGSCKIKTSSRDKKSLICITEYDELIEKEVFSLQNQLGILWVRKADVIMPVGMKQNAIAAFSTASGALEYARNNKLSAWELAIEYECSIGFITADNVLEMADHTLEIMRKACTPPNADNTPQFGFMPYQCEKMLETAPNATVVDAGFLNKAALCAIAVMENSCAHNLVVASPTAGSSGVLPAAILSLGEQLNCSHEQIIKGLLVSGLVGSFIANQATFGAEVAACQAENGAASAMAAGGIVQLLGGTVEQVFMAASLALQNMLGLICDPVGGLTEIPCISRNVSAVANAALSANMVIWGFNPIIPLDETILSMYQVGKMLPSELRCTCSGGLCVTKTGKEIAECMKASRPIM